MFSIDEILKATKGELLNSPNSMPIKGISIDSRAIGPQEAFIAIKGDNFDGHDFIDEAINKGASVIIVHNVHQFLPVSASSAGRRQAGIVHRGKKVCIIKVKDTTKALGDIARFQRKKFNIPVIAITGSNGKTTTKEMVAWALSKKFKVLKNEGTKNNQIGLPLTLLNLNSSYKAAVLELGTNHFGEVEYLARICEPDIGIITNIGPAHLENFRNLEGVLIEKYKLIENLKKPHIGILNADDKLLSKKADPGNKEKIIFTYGIKNPCDFLAINIRLFSKKLEFLVNKKSSGIFTPLQTMGRQRKDLVSVTGFTLKTPGPYNIYNALAAITVAQILGLAYKDIAARLATFDFPQSRLEFRQFNNIKFIDDTYNSNPLSLKRALGVLANYRTRGRKIFVMGDMLELGAYKKSFHEQAGCEAAGYCDILITVGELSKLSAEAAKGAGFNARNVFSCHTPKQARNILFDKVLPKKNDLILVKGSRLMKMEEIFKA